MDQDVIATHLKNIDRRLAKVEQNLPILATKNELKTLATKDELKTLATKEDLKTLATKDELREQGDMLRRHMTVLFEHQDGKIQLLAEHVLSLMPKPPER
jgi:hypothetical protein